MNRDLRPLDHEPVSVRAPFDVRRPTITNAAAARLDRELALREALAGVELGSYDERFLDWLAGWDIATVGGLVSLLDRVRAAGRSESTPECSTPTNDNKKD